MVIEYIRYQIGEDKKSAFETAYQGAFEPLLASPHCLSAELSRCTEDPACYVLRIEWDSEEGHLQGFRKSAEFRQFLHFIQDYVPDIQEMRHYQPLMEQRKKPAGAVEAFC